MNGHPVAATTIGSDGRTAGQMRSLAFFLLPLREKVAAEGCRTRGFVRAQYARRGNPSPKQVFCWCQRRPLPQGARAMRYADRMDWQDSAEGTRVPPFSSCEGNSIHGITVPANAILDPR